MGKKSRAERRHHHQRMIDRVKEFWFLKADQYWGTEEKRQKHIRKMAETRKPCSCYMCGNPRKHWKDKTMQEHRFEEKAKADWNKLKEDWDKVWNDNERG